MYMYIHVSVSYVHEHWSNIQAQATKFRGLIFYIQPQNLYTVYLLGQEKWIVMKKGRPNASTVIAIEYYNIDGHNALTE